MELYNRSKLRYSLIHIGLGIVSILIGAGVFGAVASEMVQSYDSSSKIAYICAVACCIALWIFGLFFGRKGFYFEKNLYKTMSVLDIELFKEQLKTSDVIIDKKAVILKDFLFIIADNAGKRAKIIEKTSLVGFFANADDGQYIWHIFDHKLGKWECYFKEAQEDQAKNIYEQICKEMPWIYHEDYESFDHVKDKMGQKKKIIKTVDEKKQTYKNSQGSVVLEQPVEVVLQPAPEVTVTESDTAAPADAPADVDAD